MKRPDNAKEIVRRWRSGPFSLTLWDTYSRCETGQARLAYRFRCNGKVIFQGSGFGCSPLRAIDSDACVASLLTFLSLRPGDTDREYFDSYTPEQMEFASLYGEELSCIAMEMEERAHGRKE